MKGKVVTRFAPSPTGSFHIGSARTALFNVLFTRQQGGEFILRIDDTDQERSKPEFEEEIHESLAWLGLKPDRVEHQSKRLAEYKKELETLIASGKAYWSDEEPVDGGRSKVIRFKNPNKRIAFRDLIRGEVEFDTTDLGDFVLAKDLDTPLYHFASVTDDRDMGVTHVIRGEDHISNTPRQILIAEAIGAGTLEYAHIPLILAPDKTKLSKRKHADLVAISLYRQAGYLPSAIINFIALLGWSPQAGPTGTDEEIFVLDELIEKFELAAVQKGGAIFNLEKLNWINREHLRREPKEVIIEKLKSALPELPIDKLDLLIDLAIDRIYHWSELEQLGKEWVYLWESPKVSTELIGDRSHLEKTRDLLSGVGEDDWEIESVKKAIWDFATEKGRGQVLGPLRLALTGEQKSLDPFTVAAVIGRSEALNRLDHAINL